MKVWRTILEKHRDAPFQTPRATHRWTTTASRATYATLEPALAVVEKMALVRTVDQLSAYVLVEAEYAGTMESVSKLPNGWNAFPHNAAAQAIGDAWYAKGATGALLVPCALIPDQNIILNQDHHDFESITIVKVHSLTAMNRPVED